MDHIIQIQAWQSPIEYPQVPYLPDKLEYKDYCAAEKNITSRFQRFKEFPAHFGYTEENLRRGDFGGKKIEDIVPFLQSWLFFGVLIEAFAGLGIPIDTKEFIRSKEDGSRVVTTLELPKYLCYWAAASCHAGTDMEKEQHRIYLEQFEHLVDSCLELSNTVFNAALTRYTTHSSEPGISSMSVLLSIAILGEILNHVLGKIRWNSAETPNLRWTFPPFRKSLLNAGWCIAESIRLEKECSPTCLLYLSTLDRTILRKNHGKCTADRVCQADQIVFSTYETKHARDCDVSKCSFIGPSMDEMCAILLRGDVPLVFLDDSIPESKVRLISFSGSRFDNHKYVAISHVWSDGLGNPYGNELPKCQLNRIQQRVNQLYPEDENPVAFWIDTLCVPLLRELKPLALKRMALSYSAADIVLVLDNSLQYISSLMDPIETLFRIRYCSWMARLWTLQEGRLARTLCFQFEDTSVTAAYLLDSQKIKNNHIMISELLKSLDQKELITQPNAIQLMRALAHHDSSTHKSIYQYASLPKQQNPAEEEARILALDLLENQKEEIQLHEYWKPLLEALHPNVALSEIDLDLNFKIRSTNLWGLDILLKHGIEAMQRMKGLVPVKEIEEAGLQTTIPNEAYKNAVRFLDVCRGLQGRTTSRLEDETICLSVMSGLDPSKLDGIPVLHWRLKEFLSRIKNISMPNTLGTFVIPRIDRVLGKCHEARMQMTFSQIDKIPGAMIFWTGPRIDKDGWRWLPWSFLNRELKINSMTDGLNSKASRREEGLMVKFAGFRFQSLRNENGQYPPLSSLLLHELRLYIHYPYGDLAETCYGTKCFLLDRSSGALLSKLLRTSTSLLKDVAILVQHSRSNSPAILLKVYKEEEDIVFTKHLSQIAQICTKRNEGDITPEIHISARRISSFNPDPHDLPGMWCIG